ncbi:MAG: DNA primase [Actinomycetota bacterium]
MPGLIKADVVAAVKDRTSIEDVVGEQVTLRQAGVGSLKGLCPFHDERTPSFHVRPQVGAWHCFGCGEGGDVIAFIQRIDHVTFAEAVERLAGAAGITVEYEDGPARPRAEGSSRVRILAANSAAAKWYTEQLDDTDAKAGREFLAERGFGPEATIRFRVGYAPRSGDGLLRFLRGRGFTDAEIVTAGLAAMGQRGPYDRFRGRLIWPIRDVSGDIVGFGARRLYDDDRIEAKYLNTSETEVFKKSKVLYGIDLAKRAIATQRRAVVVEGYTDVMACHVAGVTTAIATCGTAFGADHIRVLRRIMRDDDDRVRPGEVVFTFDGDAAGQAAARRAFEQDEWFVSQTFVAIAPENMDPCDVRQRHGDQAVRDLVAGRTPLFDFVLTSTLADFDLNHPAGRVQALRAGAAVVARVKDPALRSECVRRLAGLVGVDMPQAQQAVSASMRERVAPQRQRGAQRVTGTRAPTHSTPGGGSDEASGLSLPAPDLRNPAVMMERQLLQCILQYPLQVDETEYSAVSPEAFQAPAHRAVHSAVMQLGGLVIAAQGSLVDWVERIATQVPDEARRYVTDLAVSPVPASDPEQVTRLANSLLAEIAHRDLVRQEREVHSRLQRLDAAGDSLGYMAALREAQAIVERRVALQERR